MGVIAIIRNCLNRPGPGEIRVRRRIPAKLSILERNETIKTSVETILLLRAEKHVYLMGPISGLVSFDQQDGSAVGGFQGAT